MAVGFDFAAAEEKAAGMTTEALLYAIQDIRGTLVASDAMDRSEGTDQGGKYRDEASVYHRELSKRKVCGECGTVLEAVQTVLGPSYLHSDFACQQAREAAQ